MSGAFPALFELTEDRVREIVREELAAQSRSVVDADTVAHLRERLDQLLNHPDQVGDLGRQLDVAQDHEAQHALARLFVERTLERLIGTKVVGDHAAEHGAGGPGVGDVQVFPAHGASPSLADDAPSVGERPGPAGEVGPGHTQGGAR